MVNIDLRFEQKRNRINDDYINSLLDDREQNKLLIDRKTYSLITLAVRSNNDNEARNAAVQACKKIILLVAKR